MRENYLDNGRQVFSYQTVILERHNDLTIGNVTYYSHTTIKHQLKANVWQADVRMDDVPKGATDLLALAIKSGLIVANLANPNVTVEWVVQNA